MEIPNWRTHRKVRSKLVIHLRFSRGHYPVSPPCCLPVCPVSVCRLVTVYLLLVHFSLNSWASCPQQNILMNSTQMLLLPVDNEMLDTCFLTQCCRNVFSKCLYQPNMFILNSFWFKCLRERFIYQRSGRENICCLELVVMRMCLVAPDISQWW